MEEKEVIQDYTPAQVSIGMFISHLKQVEQWGTLFVHLNRPKEKFKMLCNNVITSTKQLNKFLADYDESSYELSAELSDNILEIAKLPEEKRNEVYDLIKKLRDEKI
jgi:hypothetical protein